MDEHIAETLDAFVFCTLRVILKGAACGPLLAGPWRSDGGTELHVS